MRTFFVYLFLEFKKSVKVLLKSAGSSLLMLCMVMAGAAAASYVFFGAQMFKVIDVGVAVPEEETQTKAVVRFLSAMESVESICNFEYLTQDAAMEKLYDGEIQAVIVLPESLYDDMYIGQKGKISVYLPREAPFQVQVFQELLSDGVSLLQTAEAGVLAARDMAEDGFSKMKPSKVAESVSYTYIEHALDREDLFDKNVYSPLGQTDLYQYYFAAAVSVLLLMSGLNYSFLYQGQSRAVEQKLRVLGLGALKVSVIKILVMAEMSWIFGTAAYLSGCLFSKWQKSYFIWFHKEILLWLIPAGIAAAVYFHIVYSAFGRGMQGAVFLLLALLITQIHLPSAEDARVGICAASEESAQRILGCLKTRESIFEFLEYVNEEDMRRDIVSGVIECGFAFSGDDAQKGSVTYICTPFSAKGLAAQETFYAAFFEVYSDRILIDSEAGSYGKSDEEITRELLLKKQDYLETNEMFQMDIIEIEQKSAGEASRAGDVPGRIPPMRGMTGQLIFVILWMAQARKFEDHGNGAAAAMERRQRWKFGYLGCLAEATIPAAVAIVLILLSAEHRSVTVEIGSMLLFVFVSSFWVLAVGRLFQNSTTFAAWTLTIILAQMVLCPVFFDLAVFVPAVQGVRWVFPLGWLY